MLNFMDIPIKKQRLPLPKSVTLREINEKFVDISIFSKGTIKVNMQYAKKKIPSAIKNAFVRESVAQKLVEAKKLLPSGYTFEILDAWRPYGVQLELFNLYKKQIILKSSSNLTEAEIVKKVCEFVSYPDKSNRISYVHSSGGAVDITILDSNGDRLNMGTEFDDFSEKSYTAWYEQNEADDLVKKNRRLLHNVLSECGFTNYPAEWWHYDFGDMFWAFYSRKDAFYSSKYEESEVKRND